MDNIEVRRRKKKMKKIIIDTIKNADILSIKTSAEIINGPALVSGGSISRIDSGVRELSIRFKTKS